MSGERDLIDLAIGAFVGFMMFAPLLAVVVWGKSRGTKCLKKN